MQIISFWTLIWPSIKKSTQGSCQCYIALKEVFGEKQWLNVHSMNSVGEKKKSVNLTNLCACFYCCDLVNKAPLERVTNKWYEASSWTLMIILKDLHAVFVELNSFFVCLFFNKEFNNWEQVSTVCLILL